MRPRFSARGGRLRPQRVFPQAVKPCPTRTDLWDQLYAGNDNGTAALYKTGTYGFAGGALSSGFSCGQKSVSTRFVVSSSRLSLISTASPRTSITTTPSSVSQAWRPRKVRQESTGG